MLYLCCSSGKQVRILHETVAVRYTERLPLTHRRRMGTMPLEGSEKAEGFRIESEDPENRSHPFLLAVPS